MCQIQQKWAELQVTDNPNPLDNRFSANLPTQAQPNTCAQSNISKKDVRGGSVNNIPAPTPCDDTNYHPNLRSVKLVTSPGGLYSPNIRGARSQVSVPQLTGDFWRFGISKNVSSLTNVGNTHSPRN